MESQNGVAGGGGADRAEAENEKSHVERTSAADGTGVNGGNNGAATTAGNTGGVNSSLAISRQIGNSGYTGERVSAGSRRGGGSGGAGGEDDAETKPGKVFIGGLSWETNEDSLKEYFERFGQLVTPPNDCVIMRDRQTGKPRGFGFVTFAEEADAKAAVQQRHVLDGREVGGRICIEVYNAVTGKPTKKIFVGGLPHEIRSSEFRGFFGKFGEVADAQVMMDRKTGNSRGFGFVTFMAEESAERVLGRGMNTAKIDFNGKMVEVKRAESRTALQSRRDQGGNDLGGRGGDFPRDRRVGGGGVSAGPVGMMPPGLPGQSPQQLSASQNVQLSPHLAAQYAQYYGGMWQQYAAAVAAVSAAYGQGGGQGGGAEQSGYAAAAQQQQPTSANAYPGVYGQNAPYGSTGGYGTGTTGGTMYGADPRLGYGGGGEYSGGMHGGGRGPGGGGGSSGGATRHISSVNDRYHPYGR